MTRTAHVTILPALCLALGLAGCLQQSIKEEDRPLLITVQDLEPYGVSVPETRDFESMRRTVYADRSVEIEYEYDAPEDMEGIDPIYLFITRKGKKIYTIMLSGLYFDDVEVWRELLEPRLNYMLNYEP